MNKLEHLQRHKELHAALDELFADYIAHHVTGSGFLQMPLIELINWSSRQAKNPDEIK